MLRNNSAGLGGAISNRYGTLNVQGNSQIYGNNATDFGGAIYNHGTANITNATVRDNEAEDSGVVFITTSMASSILPIPLFRVIL